MNCAGKPVKSLLLMVAVLFLLVMTGCVTHTLKASLIYPEAKPDLSAPSKNTKIYVQKPDISQLLMQQGMYSFGTMTVSNIISQTINFVTDDNPGDWIAGALSQELRVSGYSVEFINETNDKLEKVIRIAVSPISLSYGKILTDMNNPVVHRASLKLNFSLYQLGNIIKQFTLSNEKDYEGTATLINDMEKYGLDGYLKRLQSYREVALRDTLQEILKNAVPVITETFEEQ